MSKHTPKLGDRIYYTGDRANQEGYGVVQNVTVDNQIQIKLDAGNKFTVSPAYFDPSPGRRFWLESEWRADRDRRIEEGLKYMRRAIGH